MFCGKCGADNGEGAAFCKSCGQTLSAGQSAGQAPAVGQSFQAPQYQQPVGGQIPYVNNNMGWAIAALLLFWPIGIPAIINSNRVNEQLMRGDQAGAQVSAGKAKTFGKVAIWITAAWVALWIIIAIILAAAAA